MKQASLEDGAKRCRDSNMQDLVRRSCKPSKGGNPRENSPSRQREQNLDTGTPVQTNMNSLCVKAEAPKPPGEWWAGYEETRLMRRKPSWKLKAWLPKEPSTKATAPATFRRPFLNRHRAGHCHMQVLFLSQTFKLSTVTSFKKENEFNVDR